MTVTGEEFTKWVSLAISLVALYLGLRGSLAKDRDQTRQGEQDEIAELGRKIKRIEEERDVATKRADTLERRVDDERERADYYERLWRSRPAGGGGEDD